MSHTHLWQALKGSRIFVTGGTGFIGSCLLDSFLTATKEQPLDIQLTLLTRDPQRFRDRHPSAVAHPAITLHKGDVRDFVFPAGQFDVILHGATDASASLNENNPFLMFDTITTGTRRVLELAAEAQARKFLYVSSGAIYGRQPVTLYGVDETFEGRPSFDEPRAAYGIGKGAAEHLCAIAARQYGFDVLIARCFAFVGPWLPLNIHFAIGNFIRDAMTHKVIQVKGDGSPLRSWLYSTELAGWLLTILLNGKSLYPYNVGSDEIYSIAEAARLVAEVAGPEVTVEIASAPRTDALPERYLPDISRARTELSLAPLIPLREGIRRTLEWYRAHPGRMPS